MSGIDFAYKTINDPVHGSIKVSNTELKVIDTPTFQRLRGLKQLGLADLAFPGATHTRFAHSIGVLHIVSEMLDAIDRNSAKRNLKSPFDDNEKQKIRLAALLHDVGHLPLSHAMEHPIQRLLKDKSGKVVAEKTQAVSGRQKSFGVLDDTANAARATREFKHEDYGRDILVRRKDLASVISDFNSGNEIGMIFTKDHLENFKYSQFVTGTLDADRLDFLLRDSQAAGVSYGNIDLRYLLDNFQYDQETEQFYIDYSGIHALEHFITSRFFLYNVTYHKTVMGFELLAKYAYYRMVSEGRIEIISGKQDLYELLDDTDRFMQFDDRYFWTKLWSWAPTGQFDTAVRNALLFRNPVKELFAERELLDATTGGRTTQFKVLNSQLYNNLAFDEILSRHKIDRTGLAILRNGIDFEESPPVMDSREQPDIKKEWALCKVLYNNEIQPLIRVPGSIIAKLSYLNLHMKRLYYFPLDPNQILERETIRKELISLAADA